MSGLVFIVAVGRDEHRAHHSERAVGSCNHIAHNVAVVVFARPQNAALAAHYARNDVVDEGIHKVYARLFKLLFIVAFVNFVEDILEAVVVSLGDCVLCAEPQRHFVFEGVVETAYGKTFYRLIEVVHALHYSVAAELFYKTARNFVAVLVADDEVGAFARLCARFDGVIDVAVGVTGEHYGRLPAGHVGSYALYDYGRAEHGAVEYAPYGAVGALPHLFQLILLHALRVGGDGGALYGNAVLLCGISRVLGNLVVRPVPFGQTQIVVLGFEVYVRLD